MQAKLNTNDIIDVRDIIERYETLENEITTSDADTVSADALAESLTLAALLDELMGNGGDEKWRGDWYPITLIRDSYFKTYAQELAEDCDMIDRAAQWPNTCIDWTQAARELQHDYLATEIDGVTYWYR